MFTYTFLIFYVCKSRNPCNNLEFIDPLLDSRWATPAFTWLNRWMYWGRGFIINKIFQKGVSNGWFRLIVGHKFTTLNTWPFCNKWSRFNRMYWNIILKGEKKSLNTIIGIIIVLYGRITYFFLLKQFPFIHHFKKWI